MKRMMSFILALAMLVSMMPVSAFHVHAEAPDRIAMPELEEEMLSIYEQDEVSAPVVLSTLQSGTCGENLTWTLDTDGVLTISGEGEMSDFDYKDTPWYKYCGSIVTCVIEDGVTSIGNYAFYDCTILVSITIPNSVARIGEFAFDGCTDLMSVTIPEGVTSVEIYTFYDCSSLASINIPNSVTSIGRAAFENCVKLTSIDIPASVTSIGEYVFDGCSSLQAINVDDENKTYCSDENGVLYNKDKTLLIRAPGGISGVFDIPESVVEIEMLAFYDCRDLERVDLHEGITHIGASAFMRCSSLKSISIPDSMQSIEPSVFAECTSLRDISIGCGIQVIEDYAFYECKIKNVYIKDLKAWCGMTIKSNPLNYANLYVNGELVRDLIIPYGVTHIAESAFSGCDTLTSVTFPETVTRRP